MKYRLNCYDTVRGKFLKKDVDWEAEIIAGDTLSVDDQCFTVERRMHMFPLKTISLTFMPEEMQAANIEHLKRRGWS